MHAYFQYSKPLIINYYHHSMIIFFQHFNYLAKYPDATFIKCVFEWKLIHTNVTTNNHDIMNLISAFCLCRFLDLVNLSLYVSCFYMLLSQWFPLMCMLFSTQNLNIDIDFTLFLLILANTYDTFFTHIFLPYYTWNSPILVVISFHFKILWTWLRF